MNAAPALPHVFGDRMVLQRDAPILIWGWADPGEKITVTLGGAQAFATANAQRDWRVELPPRIPAGLSRSPSQEPPRFATQTC